MKLFIFGASGVGKTTLGRDFAEKMNWIHLDADSYYWKKTAVPYETAFPKSIRHQNIKRDFEASDNVIVSGGVINWNEYWKSAFDLAIWLYIPVEVRMKCLQLREVERYGTSLQTDFYVQQKSKAFLDWAACYDDVDFDDKSITRDKYWMELLTCPVVKIEGDTATTERIYQVQQAILNL